MKRRITYITLVVIVILQIPALRAQVIDTSKSINTWTLQHNYSRFEDTQLDTLLFEFTENFNPRQRYGSRFDHLGILGHAAQDRYFFNRPGPGRFIFGNSLQPYLATPERTVFFNTKNPFTELSHTTIPAVDWREETVRARHTQNMTPFSNIGIDFELLSGKELYPNEETRVSRVTLFGSHARDKYSVFGTVHYNKFDNRENGGLTQLSGFQKDSLEEPWLYDVHLENAVSGYSNIQLFLTQKYALSQKVTTTDSTGVTHTSGKNIFLNHQLLINRNVRTYSDQPDRENLSPIYDTTYYFQENVTDSVFRHAVTNTVQLIWGDPYTDKFSARIYGGHEVTRYGYRYPRPEQAFAGFDTLLRDPLLLDSAFTDTAVTSFTSDYFNELFVGFHMAGPPGNLWDWNVDGKYYLAGYYRNNFDAVASFSRKLDTIYDLGLSGRIENRNASYFHNRYRSAFFAWENNFRASQLIKAKVFLRSQAKMLSAEAAMGILTNHIYWDENAMPQQYNKGIYLVSANLYKRFAISGFRSDNRLMLQYATPGDIIHLPLATFTTSNYWEQPLFDHALLAQLGFTLSVESPWYGDAYMPATGVFYLQNRLKTGGYPFLDAFLAWKIKRTRFFLSYNNVLSGIVSNNFFTAYGYPSKPRYLRFGLVWTFYD